MEIIVANMDEELKKETSEKNLACVLFPGIIKNEEKAIKCLGGLKAISQVETQPTKKRLGLTYNPDNPMLKKIYADYKKVSGVLFKLKVKKTRVGDEIKREVISTSVVARVQNMHKFESMCDYQYLPITDDPEGEQKCLIEQVLPSGLNSVDFMNEPAPSFIMPSQFSRVDKPSYYSYVDKKFINKHTKENYDDDTHNRTRADRSIPTSLITFDLVSEWPTQPHEQNVFHKDKRIESDKKKQQDYETIKKLFEERPIWSINLLKYKTNIRHSALKYILPCIGVYMKNGPWRNLWVRFGYDPRKEPAARFYQTLDFRFRHEGGFHTLVESRDSKVHQKRADRVFASSGPCAEPRAEDVPEGAVLFRAGLLPTQRQIYYQYCDIEVPEVQAMVSAAGRPGALCHAVRGWLPPDCDTYCRDQIFRYVKDAYTKSRAGVKLELQHDSSDEGMNSEDGGASTSAMDVDV